MTTLVPNHAAQMRETYLSVTAAHRLAFKDHDGFHQDLLDDGVATDLAREYPTLSQAQDMKREAIGATAAILAKVFGGRA